MATRFTYSVEQLDNFEHEVPPHSTRHLQKGQQVCKCTHTHIHKNETNAQTRFIDESLTPIETGALIQATYSDRLGIVGEVHGLARVAIVAQPAGVQALRTNRATKGQFSAVPSLYLAGLLRPAAAGGTANQRPRIAIRKVLIGNKPSKARATRYGRPAAFDVRRAAQ